MAIKKNTAELTQLELFSTGNTNHHSSYMLFKEEGIAKIKCLICGKSSTHPGDIAHRYCGFCKVFHGDKIES